jgi:hypothetical protein
MSFVAEAIQRSLMRFLGGVVIGIAILLAFGMLIYHGEKYEAEKGMEHRKELCDTFCPDGLWVEVYRQKIGFGSFEWRCLCEDGTYKVVP